MKIDLTQPVLNELGEPVPDGPFKTLRSMCATALFTPIKGDDALPVEKRAELGFLGLQIQSLDEIELTAEQVTTLKARIGAVAPNLVVYRAFHMLDPGSVKAPPPAMRLDGVRPAFN